MTRSYRKYPLTRFQKIVPGLDGVVGSELLSIPFQAAQIGSIFPQFRE